MTKKAWTHINVPGSAKRCCYASSAEASHRAVGAEQEHRTQVPSTHAHATQSGQAALEALISLLVLAVLWACITWLGRIQDLALHASHAARYSAFMATRLDSDVTPVLATAWTPPLASALTATAAPPSASTAIAVRTGVFSGPGNQWSDRRGQPLRTSVYQDIDVTFLRNNVMTARTQIGGNNSNIMQLRNDWGTEDKGVLSAHVSLIPNMALAGQGEESSLLKLYQLDAAYPVIRRHASILTGAGHSRDDPSTADRIASSELAWSGPAENSYRVGRGIASVASKVDSAWGRPEPVFDWLGPWAEHLPGHHLRPLP